MIITFRPVPRLLQADSRMKTAQAFLQDLQACGIRHQVHWGPPIYIQDEEDWQTLPHPAGCLLEVLWLMLEVTPAQQWTPQGQWRGRDGAA